MTRTKLLSEISYALKYIGYNDEERKEVKAAFKKLKADLKRIKPLERENKELIAAVDEFIEENNQHMVNQGLKIKKLKKAIEILKDKFKYELGVSFVGKKYHYSLEFLFNNSYMTLTKEQYELLDEVLCNDK